MARFEYECPHCGNEMEGDFGEDVHCEKCNKTYETDWEYTNVEEGCMSAWLIGKETNSHAL